MEEQGHTLTYSALQKGDFFPLVRRNEEEFRSGESVKQLACMGDLAKEFKDNQSEILPGTSLLCPRVPWRLLG